LYFYFIKSVNRSDELFREIQPPFSINLFFVFFQFQFLILINAVINQSQSKGKMYLFRGGGFSGGGFSGGSFCSGDGVMIVHMRLSTIMTNFFSMFVSFVMS
jgi:hypothetical protein